MALPGEGWRVPFGWTVSVIQMLIWLASVACIYFFHGQAPLNARSLGMSCVMQSGAAIMLLLPLTDALGEQIMPCVIYYWLNVIATPLFMGPILLNGWRLIRLYGLDDMKKQLHFGKRRMVGADIDRIQLYRRWHSEKYLALLCAAYTTVIILASMPPFFTSTTYFSADWGCRIGPPPWFDHYNARYPTKHFDEIDIVYVINTVITTPISLGVQGKLKALQKAGRSESLGLFTEIFGSSHLLLTGFLVFSSLKWAAYDGYMTSWNYIILASVQPSIYSVVFILYPVAMAQPAVRQRVRQLRKALGFKQREPTNKELTCLSMLQDKRGFAYMVAQARSEFCEETVWCLKALWAYKAAATFAVMMSVFNNYIEDGAPLQVNIAAAARERVGAAVNAVQPEATDIEIADIFADVETELMKLLENNTFIRLKKSPMYAKYLNGESLDTDVSSTGGSSAMTNTSHLTIGVTSMLSGMTSGEQSVAPGQGKRASTNPKRQTLTAMPRSFAVGEKSTSKAEGFVIAVQDDQGTTLPTGSSQPVPSWISMRNSVSHATANSSQIAIEAGDADAFINPGRNSVVNRHVTRVVMPARPSKATALPGTPARTLQTRLSHNQVAAIDSALTTATTLTMTPSKQSRQLASQNSYLSSDHPTEALSKRHSFEHVTSHSSHRLSTPLAPVVTHVPLQPPSQYPITDDDSLRRRTATRPDLIVSPSHVVPSSDVMQLPQHPLSYSEPSTDDMVLHSMSTTLSSTTRRRNSKHKMPETPLASNIVG